LAGGVAAMRDDAETFDIAEEPTDADGIA